MTEALRENAKAIVKRLRRVQSIVRLEGADAIEFLLDRLEAADGKVELLEGRCQELRQHKTALSADLWDAELALAKAREDTIADIASALAGRGDIEQAEFVAGMKGEGDG